ncbi:hypothetical protein RchiOBHm_Chr2g0163651 [Rosa chinensis]|uniref:Uncharacterized protein n=1 Tax=Rosa chinensis TaxID=74649 RepID=A0A2P6S3B5_ROSCH|nr:hypothetical protein RchiOBHm_Chr2g0163651 [Rosa chinensis]
MIIGISWKWRTERNLGDELENAQKTLNASRSRRSNGNSKTTAETGDDTASSKKAILDKLGEGKIEFSSMEVVVQDLEKKWGEVQDNALSQPFPGILHHQICLPYPVSISMHLNIMITV